MNTTEQKIWVSASKAWLAFCEAHPELGFKSTPSPWAYFRRTRAKKLVEQGVIRKVSLRRRMIADSSQFDRVVFELLTTGGRP